MYRFFAYTFGAVAVLFISALKLLNFSNGVILGATAASIVTLVTVIVVMVRRDSLQASDAEPTARESATELG